MRNYADIDKMMSYKDDRKESLLKLNKNLKTNFLFISQAYKNLYLLGYSARQIGIFFDVDKDTIFHQLRNMNIKRRSKGGANNIKKRSISC